MIDVAFPEFRPHRFLRGGHAQTLAGAFLPWRRVPYRAVQHRVELPDGDVLVLHDDRPAGWQPGDRVVLLMHGLAGCHRSGYMVRVAHRLVERGFRAFRLDLRGCGAGAGLARHPYHAGRSEDVDAVAHFLTRLCPQSPIGLVGFSLSGNVLLKYLGENSRPKPGSVDRAMAINPPVDLHGCVRELDRFANRMYDRHFVRLLRGNVKALRRNGHHATVPQSYCRPRTLFEFDEQYTAPAAGYENAADYYARCSASRFVAGITVPTLILAARDDPLIPVGGYERLQLPGAVRLHLNTGGGHLGYIARPGDDPDRRWMDWRIVDWVTARPALGQVPT